jgi:uncharacterized membrane protein YfcA
MMQGGLTRRELTASCAITIIGVTLGGIAGYVVGSAALGAAFSVILVAFGELTLIRRARRRRRGSGGPDGA